VTMRHMFIHGNAKACGSGLMASESLLAGVETEHIAVSMGVDRRDMGLELESSLLILA